MIMIIRFTKIGLFVSAILLNHGVYSVTNTQGTSTHTSTRASDTLQSNISLLPLFFQSITPRVNCQIALECQGIGDHVTSSFNL
jgi:hypothetical protein